MRGCELLLQALTQMLYLNSRKKDVKLPDILAKEEVGEEMKMLLAYFKKYPKHIELALLDALGYMGTVLSRHAADYSDADVNISSNVRPRENLASPTSRVSELVLQPLLCPIDARFVSRFKEATQVRQSDSLLGLTGVASSRSVKRRPARRAGQGAAANSHPQEQLTLVQFMSDRCKGKYFPILTKYFALSCKQCSDMFKYFSDEESYQRALLELSHHHQLQNQEKNSKKKKRGLRVARKKSVWMENDVEYECSESEHEEEVEEQEESGSEEDSSSHETTAGMST